MTCGATHSLQSWGETENYRENEIWRCYADRAAVPEYNMIYEWTLSQNSLNKLMVPEYDHTRPNFIDEKKKMQAAVNFVQSNLQGKLVSKVT